MQHRHSVLFFGHHFRDLLIPTFMVVIILILIGNIIFNHILLCLASRTTYFQSGDFVMVTQFLLRKYIALEAKILKI